MKALTPRGKNKEINKASESLEGRNFRTTEKGPVDVMSHRDCTRVTFNDGYGYSWSQQRTALTPTVEAEGFGAG